MIAYTCPKCNDGYYVTTRGPIYLSLLNKIWWQEVHMGVHGLQWLCLFCLYLWLDLRPRYSSAYLLLTNSRFFMENGQNFTPRVLCWLTDILQRTMLLQIYLYISYDENFKYENVEVKKPHIYMVSFGRRAWSVCEALNKNLKYHFGDFRLNWKSWPDEFFYAVVRQKEFRSC